MNKSIKIILLLLAIIGVVGGVMAYYKTIVSPPGKLTFKNQYVISIKEDIAKVKSATTDISIDSIYNTVTHELDFQLSNKNLTNQERDELLESFATQYVPVFVSSCNSKFSQSYWDEGNLKRINNKIAELRDIVSTDKKVIIQGEVQSSLSNIHNVIVNYYKAKRVASANGYNGIQSAKQRIAEAKQYATMSPLNNCLDLMNRLNSVASRLEQAHYAYIANQVERLRAYYNYNQSDYDNVALSVYEKLDEYKKNAKSTYGRMSDISALEGRAGSYYSNAKFD
ncbi:MAG: hypothetical protein RR061_01515 [Muribaculaceae bacterium]